jgi:general secretion pathway protein D
VEVELITTDETSSLSYGLSLPNSISLVWFGNSTNLTTTVPSGFTNFLGFGGGRTLLGLGIANASLFANVSKASSQTLLRSEIVTSDGQAATLHVGDKYPIQTNGYFGATTTSGTVYTPPPSFNFEDLGLLLKITPHVHGMDDISLEVESEFKLLGSTSVDGIPVISNRKFQSKVRLTTGEWAVLAGLMTQSEGRTVSGIAGLSVIPALRSNTGNKDRGETIIVLKPHLLNLPPTETPTKAAWIGTETKPRSAM